MDYIYTLQINIYTDGSFNWDIVPSGFNCDNEGSYWINKTFNNTEEVIEWTKYINILIDNLHGKKAVCNKISKSLNDLKTAMFKNICYCKSFGSEYNVLIHFNKTVNIDQKDIDKLAVTLYNKQIKMDDVFKLIDNLEIKDKDNVDESNNYLIHIDWHYLINNGSIDENKNRAIELAKIFIRDLHLTMDDIEDLRNGISDKPKNGTIKSIIELYEFNSEILSYVLNIYEDLVGKAQLILYNDNEREIICNQISFKFDEYTKLAFDYAVNINPVYKINDTREYKITGYNDKIIIYQVRM